MFTQEELDRLPKWAFRKAEALMQNCEYHTRRLAEVVGGEGASEVVFRDHFNPFNLPKGSRVGFTVSSGTIEVYVEDDEVVARVVAGNHALERLSVIPHFIQEVGLRVEAR